MIDKPTIELDGPFFRKKPGQTFYQNLGDMLDRIAAEMEDMARGEIEAHSGSMPYYTGWTRNRTFGYTTSPKTGKHWATYAAVATVTAGMSKKDAIRTKAAAASIEKRWHPFRKVKSALYRSRALITADLTEGLN